MNTIGSRIRELMESKNFTPYKLHKHTTISQSTIGRILKDENVPNGSTIDSIANFLGVNSEWIKTGEGQKELHPDEIPVQDAYELEFTENKNANYYMKLPNGQYLMTMPLAEFSVQAGFLDHYQDVEFLSDLSQHSIIVDKPYRGRYVAFRAKGDSMDDGSSDAIVQNSIVSTRELQQHLWTSKLRIKDFPYWVIYTTESRMPLLKEIIKHDTTKGTITCHSKNDGPEYADFELRMDTVQALFYVVDVSRSVSKKANY